ncbi:MAG: hypothetical protein ACE14P_11540 [Methanotrichaceae archaeon]
MLLYTRIASVLEEINRASRGDKPGIASEFLAELEEDNLYPSVRLLVGRLWPYWELREMGLGQEIILDVLEEISLEDIQLLRKTVGEIGAVTETALLSKSQKLLSSSALDSLSVYKDLLRVSDQTGPGSDTRKAAILRGLLLLASPVEGKYISRTVMGNTNTGLGPRTMISAISEAFDYSHDIVEKAYSFMPDIGMIALAALTRKLDNIIVEPPRPIKPIQLRKDDTALIEAYLQRYPGLRLQIHRIENKFYAYTARLRNITPALAVLFRDIEIEHDFVAETVLVGSQDGKALNRSEVIRYINRRHFSRRSSIDPALIAFDLLYIDGEDLTGNSYAERRQRMISTFGMPKAFPFKGISSAEEIV